MVSGIALGSGIGTHLRNRIPVLVRRNESLPRSTIHHAKVDVDFTECSFL
jgi:hypothetical protein